MRLIRLLAAPGCGRAVHPCGPGVSRRRAPPDRDRQVGPEHDRVAGRRAAVPLAGVDRRARLRHAVGRVHAVPHGEGPLQPRVGRRADAALDLLHQAGPRHPRHQPSRATSAGRRRTAACGSSPRTRACCSAWCGARAWPTPRGASWRNAERRGPAMARKPRDDGLPVGRARYEQRPGGADVLRQPACHGPAERGYQDEARPTDAISRRIARRASIARRRGGATGWSIRTASACTSTATTRASSRSRAPISRQTPYGWR